MWLSPAQSIAAIWYGAILRYGRKSAPAYLFGVPKAQDALEELERHSQAVTGAQIRQEVERSLGREPTIEIADLPVSIAPTV